MLNLLFLENYGWGVLLALLLSTTLILLAHKKNVRKSTQETHEKGVRRDKQKYKDKKRKTENWLQNPNAKPKKRKKK